LRGREDGKGSKKKDEEEKRREASEMY